MIDSATTPPQQPRLGIIAIAICAVIIAAMAMHIIGTTFLLLVAAFFLANIFMPLVEFFNRRKVPTTISIFVVLAIVAGIFFGVFLILQQTAASFVESIPKYQSKWEDVYLPSLSNFAGGISSGLQQKVQHLDVKSAFDPGLLAGFVLSITSFVSDMMVLLLFMFFMLASNNSFRKKIPEAFEPPLSDRLKKVLEEIDTRVHHYLGTLLVLNLVSAIALYIVLSIFGLDLALLWSVLTFLLLFIPSIGSVIAMLMPITVGFIQFDSVGTALAMAAFVVVTQVVLGSIITPRVMGSRMNLSPLLILVSMVFWGWVWGPLGMILAVPLCSTFLVVFENIEPLRPLAILMSVEPKKIKRGRGRPSKSAE